ncbi:MAG: RNA 2',3'-cyclic phosphodiesterase [Deltaproteobacteria bacterium]|nr:RNA 2',3'-cyclic phosphodiesterase [Deltaproteobacteria bacterium]
MASAKIRAFIAIEIPDELKERLGALRVLIDRGGLRGVTWPKPEVVHLTLKFLDEVDEADVPKIDAVLEAAAEGIHPFTLVAEHIGAFPSLKSPRVVWAGVRDSEILARLHANMEDGLERLGFERERGRYRPHITLCRVKSFEDSLAISRAIEEANPDILMAFKVGSFALFKSVLAPRGAVHTPVSRVELK